MDHVSEFFKKGFMNLHKNKIEKNYQQKTLRDRMDNFNNMRRETRNTLIFQKRNIDVNMTPINTPEKSRIIKKPIEKNVNKGTIKRLEMLKMWKEEKEKNKQLAKQKSKPIFKVCHVPVEVGLPDLEKVNKEIKGKPISQFAPADHKFHAPKNIEPIYLGNSNSSILRKSKKNNNLAQESTSQLQNSIRTRSQKVELKKLNVSSQNQSSIVDAKRKNAVKDVPAGTSRRTNPNNNNQKSTGLQRQNSKASSNFKPKVVSTDINKRTEKKNNISTSATNSKLSVKCSVPKKSKKSEILDKKENANNNFKPPSTLKTGATKKELQKEDVNNSETNKPTVNVRKTPKKSKIKFKAVNNATLGENDKPIIKTKNQGEKEKNTPSKTPIKSRKSTGSKRTSRNVGWNLMEAVIDSDDEFILRDVNPVTPKADRRRYKKTPRKSDKSPVIDDELAEQTSEAMNVEKHSSPATPKNGKSQDFSASPVYISPFVTISRGKTSARKEYQVRKSTGTAPVTPEFSKSFSESTSPKAGAKYFARKLNNEIERIQDVCKQWNSYRESNSVPEEANDMIDVAIGQSNLLISKKFQQFQNLIDQCMTFEYKEKPITCEDLHGFWDMMYMQVNDLDKRFKNLEDLKENNWKEVIPKKKPVIKRGRGRPKKTAPSSSLRELIKAARQKNKPNNDDPAALTTEVKIEEDNNGLTDKCFTVKSPVRENSLLVRPSSTRRSLRVSLLAHQTRKRISSPGLTMMKISQAIKHGDGLTPSKSILKTDEVPRSATRITKSVLFKDDLEEDIEEKLSAMKTEPPMNMDVDKENNLNEENLIFFSPQTPKRRSHRLAKIY